MGRITAWIRQAMGWLEGGASAPRRIAGPERDYVPAAQTPPATTATPANDTPGSAPGEGMVRKAIQFGSPRSDPRRAALISAFDSSHPVERRAELCGRDDKLETLFEAVLDQRHHAIVHGARGSGKTSLVRVFGDYADQQGAVLIYMACEERANFAGLMRPYLGFIPPSCLPAGQETAFRRQAEALGDAFGPRSLVELLAQLEQCQIILILDEFDRVTDPSVQSEVATLMKLLSDARVPVQLVVVGIARSVSEIIECHPSLRRHLTAIPIGRIADTDVAALIDQGAARSGIAFDDDTRALIAHVSCGSPYHVRLFCHHAGLAAIRRGSDTVDVDAGLDGLARATDAWSRLNPEDGTLFAKLVRTDRATRDTLQRMAQRAAISDGIDLSGASEGSEREATGRALLGEALVEDAQDVSRLLFRDSVAPQFLIAMIVQAEADEERPQLSRPTGVTAR